MTRRPKAAKAKRPKRSKREPLDDFIATSARTLGLTIEKSWLRAVRANLEVTLRHGALVATFPLPDDAEPAPVYEP